VGPKDGMACSSDDQDRAGPELGPSPRRAEAMADAVTVDDFRTLRVEPSVDLGPVNGAGKVLRCQSFEISEFLFPDMCPLRSAFRPRHSTRLPAADRIDRMRHSEKICFELLDRSGARVRAHLER
jgi:hypothetical protein